jgi:uncharacterized protein YjbJ (UPF0337 family)
MEASGLTKKVAGKVQQEVGDVKDHLGTSGKTIKDRVEEAAEVVKENAHDTAKKLKEIF